MSGSSISDWGSSQKRLSSNLSLLMVHMSTKNKVQVLDTSSKEKPAMPTELLELR